MARFSVYLLRLHAINPYEIMINDVLILHGFIGQDVGPYNIGSGISSQGLDMCIFRGFGPSGPNIQNSCPELTWADVSDVPGFVSCQTCPEGRFVVMPSYESFFRKLLKRRRQLDLMADIIYWRTWREKVSGPLQASSSFSVLRLPAVSSSKGLLSPSIGLGALVVLSTAFLSTSSGILPLALSLVLFFPFCRFRWRMAENRPGDREVAAATSVQIPHELPSIYRWVANDVLGAPSILDQRYLDELKATGIVFGGGGLE
ncbi:hypothetical protein PIB30_057268 [Stylosanthes scabra]|uniref:Uncharacterized protein n=1 Tax=Stylosanthes scabra TaxID=79078 RepID=A0ABU6YH33_9FABA|nr:hypothetical protein [Stylosanthes scabra]